nr:Brix-domain-containing protein [Cryptomonas curvata]
MNIKNSTLVLFISKSIKSKKFLNFVKEFYRIIASYSVIGLTDSFEKLIYKYPKICFKLGFTNTIIFSSIENRNFLQLSKTPYGPIVIFLITKFTIGKEINVILPGKRKLQSTLLLLNNFNYKKENIQIITTMIRQLFPNKTAKNNSFSNFLEGILFDFDSYNNNIEVRTYRIQGISRLFPRYLRKYKKKKSDYIETGNTDQNKFSILNTENYTKENKASSLIRVIEIGPRFTLQTINIIFDLKKNN